MNINKIISHRLHLIEVNWKQNKNLPNSEKLLKPSHLFGLILFNKTGFVFKS